MRHHLGLTLAAFCLTALLAACGDGKGDDCEPCRSTSPRCDAGTSCATFTSGGSTRELCAAPGTSTCTVP